MAGLPDASLTYGSHARLTPDLRQPAAIRRTPSRTRPTHADAAGPRRATRAFSTPSDPLDLDPALDLRRPSAANRPAVLRSGQADVPLARGVERRFCAALTCPHPTPASPGDQPVGSSRRFNRQASDHVRPHPAAAEPAPRTLTTTSPSAIIPMTDA